MTSVARFFPNGEFTLGHNFPKRRDKRTHPLEGYIKRRDEEGNVYADFQCRHIEPSLSLRLSYIGREFKSATSDRIYLCTDMDEKMRPTFYWQESNGKEYESKFSLPIGQFIRTNELIPLGLSDVRILEKTSESRKKLLTMTKNMARNVRNGVYLLERKHGKDVLSFLTLTIPSLPHTSMEKICQQWGSLVNQILKWLKYKCEKHNIPFEYVYCTEIQEKRLERLQEYAPHLHVVFRGRYGKKSPWIVTPKQIRKAWLRLLRACVGHPVDSNSVENLQRVRYSASKYLAKYVSKGVRDNTLRCQEISGSALHTHWAGMSRGLSQEIKKATSIIRTNGVRSQLAVFLFKHISAIAGTGVVKFYREGFIPLGRCPDSEQQRFIKVGVGALSVSPLDGGIDVLGRELHDYEHKKLCQELFRPLDKVWWN